MSDVIPGPVLIGVNGLELDSEDRQNLQHAVVGGVVLFSRNYSSRAQLEDLIASIHESCAVRPLICVDQEGGRVQRFREEFTRLPPLGVLGQMAGDDPERAADMAYRHARVMATEMLSIGIDLSFAPVLDLDRGSRVIGDRSFSEDPDRVIDLGRSYLAGMHDAGMKTTGKHFPGHGSVIADSHVDHVRDPRKLEELLQSDMRPFTALQEGLDSLMIAHVLYDAVDSVPAGYSPTWLRQVLREKLEYRGVVISDDLGMHAATVAGGVAGRVQRCLAAGCDLALVCMPDDVRELMSSPPVDFPWGEKAVLALYGKASLDAGELEQVDAEGIREWAYWKESLQRLNEGTWS